MALIVCHERHAREVWEEAEEGNGCKLGWINTDSPYEGLKVSVSVEVVTEIEDMVPVAELNMDHQQADATGAKLAACEGETL